MKPGDDFCAGGGRVSWCGRTWRCRRFTSFVDGSGAGVRGKVFRFCFITIACVAISGFHSLIASGTTPKDHRAEKPMHGRLVTGDCAWNRWWPSLAIIAACTPRPRRVFEHDTGNRRGRGGDEVDTVAKVRGCGVRGPRSTKCTRLGGPTCRETRCFGAHRRASHAWRWAWRQIFFER